MGRSAKFERQPRPALRQLQAKVSPSQSWVRELMTEIGSLLVGRLIKIGIGDFQGSRSRTRPIIAFRLGNSPTGPAKKHELALVIKAGAARGAAYFSAARAWLGSE